VVLGLKARKSMALSDEGLKAMAVEQIPELGL